MEVTLIETDSTSDIVEVSSSSVARDDITEDDDVDEKIEITLPGKIKRKAKKDGTSSSFPAPPPGTGSRKIHQSTGALPPPRPTQSPACIVKIKEENEVTKTSAWEQFEEDDSSSVSSDGLEDLDESTADVKVDESDSPDEKIPETSRKNSSTSIVKTVTNKTSKKIHDFLEPSEKKLAKKKAKKEKKRKRAEKSKELFSKFIYDEETGDKVERSSALKEFDEMQQRIANVVLDAEKNLQKSKYETEESENQSEAWGCNSSKEQVKTTWEGFDDNFAHVTETARPIPVIQTHEPEMLIPSTDILDTNNVDFLGTFEPTASVSSYSLVTLGDTTSATPKMVPGQFDSLIPLTSDGMTTSVSKDDVFGLSDHNNKPIVDTSNKVASNIDLFSFDDGPDVNLPNVPKELSFLDNGEFDDDDPFVIRTPADNINKDDVIIKDAIDSAFGDPFQIPPADDNPEFVATFDIPIKGFRNNPFNNEIPLDPNYDNFNTTIQPLGPDELAPESDEDEIEEEVEPFEPFEPEPVEDEFYNLYLRQPTKKKRIKSQNRFWKEVCVRISETDKTKPTINIYKSSDNSEIMQSQVMQYSYTLCNLGLQSYDQYGKCHTVKLQSVQYKERLNVKADRIAPTLSDLTKVRDFKGLKNLVHRPKATMILDHSPNATEIFKFGGRDIEQFKRFINRIENLLFKLPTPREIQTSNATYTKDDITVDIIDDYQLELNKNCHIVNHKVFCLAFLSGKKPVVELGLNHKKRQGKEVVGRKDIIPIKTDEWVRFHEPEFNECVNVEVYHDTHVLSMIPPDASHFEVMRFRVKPPQNRELPLQLQVRMNTNDKSIHIHAEILIPGYYSNSKRSPQHPCEDIQVRFPIPDEWIYLFRTEKRFRYGSVHSSTRKAGKIKGLERLTQMAQGILPGNILEVTTGSAKYEHVYHDVIWRINRLPERNHGAYKLHQFDMKLELGTHDVIPESYSPYAWVQYTRPNSMVSRAQIRSISISGDCGDGEVDKWVHHTAKYSYRVDIDFEIPKVEPDSILEIDEIPVIRDKPRLATFDSESSEDETFNGRKAVSDTDSSNSSDSD